MSWCRAHSGTCDQILLPVGMLSEICGPVCGAPSLKRGRVCNLQCNHSMARVAQNPKPYFTVSSETPTNLESKVKVTLQLTVSQSLCQDIEPILGLVTRYYFLYEGCFLKFAVLYFWGALSDERLGLSFVFLCLVIYHYLHQTFTLHVF
jgi:hypothetical protein